MVDPEKSETGKSDRLDVTLIERIAAREASAVGDLYDRHSRLLMA